MAENRPTRCHEITDDNVDRTNPPKVAPLKRTEATDSAPKVCPHRRDADLLQAASQVPYLLEHYPDDSARLEDYASELQDECNCDKA